MDPFAEDLPVAQYKLPLSHSSTCRCHAALKSLVSRGEKVPPACRTSFAACAIVIDSKVNTAKEGIE